MNRRSFVKKLGLLCLVPFVPKVLLSKLAPPSGGLMLGVPGESIVSGRIGMSGALIDSDGGFLIPREISRRALEQVYFGLEPVTFKGKPVTIRMGRKNENRGYFRR